jgi:UDP-hydrolysing UDP-N-acetyl-D-glucosamine 2-epimerase
MSNSTPLPAPVQPTKPRRRIAVVTTSRADYSHLYWPLKELAGHPDVELGVFVMGPHLSPEFGNTGAEVERDGFPIKAKIECLLSSDTDTGMAKTIGLAMLGLADALTSWRPDILLLIADRYEMLAPASVALALRIPIAHIEGGEISQGAIDDQVRNALTKMAHIHFTSTPTARRRVIAMGEEPWRVHHAGAPSLDHLRRSTLLSRGALEEKLSISLKPPIILAAWHPVTILRDTNAEAEALFASLVQIHGQILFVYPNADAGGMALIERTRELAAERRDHGSGFIRTTGSERGHAPAGARAGGQCDRRACRDRSDCCCADQGARPGLSRRAQGHGQSLRQRDSRNHDRAGADNSRAGWAADQAARAAPIARPGRDSELELKTKFIIQR